MKEPMKAFNTEWENVDGTLCIVFVGKDSLRREHRIAVPAASITMVFNADARRRILASEIETKRVEKVGHWNQVRFLRAERLEVGVTDANQVGIVFDPGTETEFTISIEPETARELGRGLLKCADKATGKAATIN
jgi:hypothetical protein